MSVFSDLLSEYITMKDVGGEYITMERCQVLTVFGIKEDEID